MNEIKLDDYRTLYVAQSLNYYVITYKNTKNGIVAPMTHDMSLRLLGKSYPYIFHKREDAEKIMEGIYFDLKNK